MPEESRSGMIDTRLATLTAQVAMLLQEVAALLERVDFLENDDHEPWQFNPPDGGENYSFKVSRKNADHVLIAPGAFVVIHISRTEKSNPQELGVGLNGYIYAKCTYAGVDTSWGGWTFGASYPEESPDYKVVVLAEIKDGEIIQRHCGDVYAYPFGGACDI